MLVLAAITLLFSSACASKSDKATTSTTAKSGAVAKKKLRVAVVTPSAENDLAFSQSMMEALSVVAKERGPAGMELAKSNSLFKNDDASAALRDYASKGFDVVIAHSSTYGALVQELAPKFPKVTFLWGTSTDTFGLPNVFAYDVASDEGGYVLGLMAAMVSKKDSIGVVGPIEVGDAKAYIDGFKKGAIAAKPAVKVAISYTGSFTDVAKAAELAKSYTTAGADALTGTSEIVAGAIPVADQAGAAWFGTQTNQTALAKKVVVASQVYHWEGSLRQIFAAVEKGTLGGQSFKSTLANGGLVIEYNPEYKLDAAVKAKGEEATKAIAAGTLKTGVS